jgi:hypothetical protein
MKTLKAVTLILLIILSVTSCQRELSIDPLSPAKGSLKNDSTGDCLGNVVSGNYQVATKMNNSNTISIQVNVNTPGSYRISTDSINGYSFRAEGTFTTTGLNTVVLKAKGVPLAAGSNNFTVSYENTTCNIVVLVLPASTNSNATFTLGSAGNTCTGATVQGAYKAGNPLNSSNNMNIQVNVTKIGSYSISTTPINGISFSTSGSFTTTGIQTVTLTGTGTPVAAGTYNISVNNSGSQCTYSLTVQPSTVSNAVFNLASSTSVCSNATAQGTYTVNSVLGSNNTVSLQVDVLTPGAWLVNSTTTNGMTFSGSGNFTSTGIQTITLSGSGTPTTAGPNLIPFTAGISTCSFIITVNADPNNPSCNPTNNTAEFSNIADITFTFVSGSAGGGSYTMTGNGNNGDVTIEFAGAAEPVPGVYNIQSIAGSFNQRDVRVSFVNSSIYWQSNTGKLYVTVANGKVTAVFCNVSFSGSLGGPSYSTVVSAKVTETN